MTERTERKLQGAGRKMRIGETAPGHAPGLQIRITERGARQEIINLKEWRKFKARAERRLGKIPDPPLAESVKAKQARARLNFDYPQGAQNDAS